MLAPARSVNDRLGLARALALAIPAALLGGALLSEYAGGLVPCDMCWWQRYPHGVAILLALGALLSPLGAPRTRLLILLAAATIAVSGAIGVFHAGVEYTWWEGLTSCATSGAASLQDIMATKLVRCDEVQWSLGGVSLAGYNALFSLGSALAIVLFAQRKSA